MLLRYRPKTAASHVTTLVRSYVERSALDADDDTSYNSLRLRALTDLVAHMLDKAATAGHVSADDLVAWLDVEGASDAELLAEMPNDVLQLPSSEDPIDADALRAEIEARLRPWSAGELLTPRDQDQRLRGESRQLGRLTYALADALGVQDPTAAAWDDALAGVHRLRKGYDNAMSQRNEALMKVDQLTAERDALRISERQRYVDCKEVAAQRDEALRKLADIERERDAAEGRLLEDMQSEMLRAARRQIERDRARRELQHWRAWAASKGTDAPPTDADARAAVDARLADLAATIVDDAKHTASIAEQYRRMHGERNVIQANYEINREELQRWREWAQSIVPSAPPSDREWREAINAKYLQPQPPTPNETP